MASRISKNSYHVIKHPFGWAVRKIGAFRATKLFKLKNYAILFAIKISKKKYMHVMIHKKDGRVEKIILCQTTW